MLLCITKYIKQQKCLKEYKKLYKILIGPIVTYGREAWVLTKRNEQRINIWERKVLRRIFEPVKDKELRRIRTIKKLMDIYREKDLVTLIKCQRMKWLRHVHRMQSNRYPKRTMEEKPGGRRNRGRPRTRWLEDVEDALRRIGVRRWRKEAKDRRTWRGICKAAQALQEL